MKKPTRSYWGAGLLAPKKIMWFDADLAHAVGAASDFGIPASRAQTDWSKLAHGRQAYIGMINRY